MKGKNCLPGLKFFSNALDMLVKQNDSIHAIPLWDIMVGSGLFPNLIMYNAMIGLYCNNNDVDNAFRLLDGMVFNRAFPDFLTFNIIFRCLIKNKKVHQVCKFFYEMIKNKNPPTHFDCSAAIMTLIDGGDPEMAIEIWNYIVENHVLPLDGSANALLIGFCNLGRMSQVDTEEISMIVSLEDGKLPRCHALLSIVEIFLLLPPVVNVAFTKAAKGMALLTLAKPGICF
ncbi:hypothetical protein D5086_006251 [Populus alba]|uniref:Uncharacterized protein n=1 Tax=Populus alba TaxID=43335 RepID=A0ACC4CK55_POPAL